VQTPTFIFFIQHSSFTFYYFCLFQIKKERKMASVSCAMASVFAKSINGRSDTKIKNAFKSKNFYRKSLSMLLGVE